MRACNNNNMCNTPYIFQFRVHTLILCVAAYIPKLKFPCAKINGIGLSFLYYFQDIRTVRSIVYTFLNIPHTPAHFLISGNLDFLPVLVLGYACMPLSSVLLHIYYTCFSNFWHSHPYILQRNVCIPFGRDQRRLASSYVMGCPIN